MEKNKRKTETGNDDNDQTRPINDGENVPFLRSMTDVGLYCVGGLCAVSLVQLFPDDAQCDFRKKALERILNHLGQPKQTNDSMLAIMEGDVMENSDAFVDSLLQEECLKETRQPLIADLIALIISDGCYDARLRVLVKHVAWQLRETWDEVEEIETELAETLEYNTYVVSEEEAKEKAKKGRKRKFKRYALIGLATVGGGALIGLTGGLAAPLVAAGAGAVIGSAGAAALGSAAGVAIIGSLFGVAGAGLTGYKMKRRIGAIEEFAFEPLTLIGSKFDSSRSVKQLHITVAVTGWLNDSIRDFRIPWSSLAECKEQYSLRWESKYLYQLGEAFDYILQTGISVATTEALKYTILSGIITAIAWPAALISVAGAIDNPWHVCTQRATETGKQLAEVLLAREQGNRPVTLIGYSLGSRVIFSCLEEMSKRKGSEGLIEDVILLGAPVSGDPKYWKPLTKVVAGKIVNGYAKGDWLLKFLYRTASVTFNVAGLGPVKWDNRRMHNIDLSDIIDGHFDYCKNLDIIMKAVGVRTKDELKTRAKKPSPKSPVQTPQITKTFVDHDCQTDDELDSDDEFRHGIASKHAIPKYKESDHNVGMEKLNLAETSGQSDAYLEVRDPCDSGLSEKGSSACGSEENLISQSTDTTSPAKGNLDNVKDDVKNNVKDVPEISQTDKCDNDSSSQIKPDKPNTKDAHDNLDDNQSNINLSDNGVRKKGKATPEIREKSGKASAIQKGNNGATNSDKAGPIGATGVVYDRSQETIRGLEMADNKGGQVEKDPIPQWESCYFTDSDPETDD